jgi:pyrroline-5-carboxylate reductase
MLGKKRIAIIGFGTMGRTLATGLVRSKTVSPSKVVVTGRTRRLPAGERPVPGVAYLADNAKAARGADVVVLCLKPRDIVAAAAELAAKGALDHRPLVISIAAAVGTASLEAVLPAGTPVVRAMPNTPCLIGKGMTVVAAGRRATARHLALARELFATVGRVLELDEKHMDTVTGLSASGPAFIFLVIESLADGGVMRGLPRQVATELVAQMTLGAAEMVLSTGKHPAALKDDVTTPAGCTIAGILVMEDGRIRSVLARGVETAARVAAELAK